MSDIMIGASAIATACVLIIVLALQFQIRSISHKIDQILDKVG